MLLLPRRNSLDSLFKEVRGFQGMTRIYTENVHIVEPQSLFTQMIFFATVAASVTTFGGPEGYFSLTCLSASWGAENSREICESASRVLSRVLSEIGVLSEVWERGKDPRPQDFSLTKKTARFTKGQFRP